MNSTTVGNAFCGRERNYLSDIKYFLWLSGGGNAKKKWKHFIFTISYKEAGDSGPDSTDFATCLEQAAFSICLQSSIVFQV